MATGSRDGRRRLMELQSCQRRLEYLGGRLQDLAVELGDGQGAVWLKENTWFLRKPAIFFDDVLFAVGKICNHLISYLTFHKQQLFTKFPFLSFMGILYEVGEVLGIVRDMLLVNPRESLSVKQTQIDLFWQDCTPFLFVFEQNNYKILTEEQVPQYMRALLDLVPTVIQVGLCMYCTPEAQLRGFDCFAETCLNLSRALVETGEFLVMAEPTEPVIVPFLRQWILFALDLVQSGVKIRTEEIMSPRLTKFMSETQEKGWGLKDDEEQTVPKTLKSLSLSSNSTLPDEVADASLAPLKICNSCYVRASCQPFRWLDVAKTHIIQCPNEQRKPQLEDISLRENQKLISDIFLLSGEQPENWKGIKMHCPLTKAYDELQVRLFVKVKRGEAWKEKDAWYEKLYGKGHFLTFYGCKMEGFVAIEERPVLSKQIGPQGGHVMFDDKMEATIPKSAMSKTNLVRMMVQPRNKPREQQYRDGCPEDFEYIQSTSNAIEIDGSNLGTDGNISIRIPYDVLMESNTKILVLKYKGDHIEIKEADDIVKATNDHCYTVNSGDGGTVLATVNRTFSAGKESQIRNEMEVLLGKKELCKLMLFVENQQADQTEKVDMDQIVFTVVCAEKHKIQEVIKEKTKIGLIELPNSQSPDRLLKARDDIKLEIRGCVELDPDIPEDAYSLTYLDGSDNFLRFPVKVKEDNGRITFVMRNDRDKQLLHTYFISVQDLRKLIALGSLALSPGNNDDVFAFEEGMPPPLPRSQTSSDIMQDQADNRDGDARAREAALKILNRNSLVNLAKYIGVEEGHRLGATLDMRQEKVDQIYRTYRHSASLASFYLLYEWRGRRTQPEMADHLIQGLRNIDRKDLANVLTKVRQKNKNLTPEDFENISVRRFSYTRR